VVAQVLARACMGALVVLGCSLALADATPFEGARIVERSGDAVVVEFAFSEDVRATAHDARSDGFDIRLRGSTSSGQWDQKVESYDGDLGAVERVTFDGSGAGGYRLAVQLGWPMTIELLPQSDSRRITVRLTKPADLERATEPTQTDAPAVTRAQIASLAAAPSQAESGDARPTATPIDAALPHADQAVDAPSPKSDAPAAESDSADVYRQALADGRQAAMTQDYPRAIALYTKAAESSDVAVRQEALEMLAMARERNHQDAHAKLIYDQFLAQYPDSEAAPRIRQRLSGLLTRALPVQKKLAQPQRDAVAWTAVGNVSQFYQRNETAVNGDKAVVGVDGLFSNADVIVNRRSESLDLGFRVSTNGLYDFGPDADSTYQMSTAYFEAKQIDWGVDVRVGRQSQQSNGVLGRYDGVQIQYKINPWLKVGAIGGYAVDYSANAFSSDRPLYGVNAEVSVEDGTWAFAPFYIEQQANGLLDRRAVGMETRYFRENVSAFSLVDYDTFHKALNTSYLMFNLRFGDGWSTYVNFDHRRSPYITTENALIGQGVNTLGTLENTYTDQQIQQLADDRTATLTMATVGFDKEISSRLQIGSDISYSDYSQTPASGDVSATPSRQDYYYTLRFRSDDFFGSQTYTALYLRYADSPDSRTSSVYWNNRFTFRNVWQLYPRMRVDYTQFTDVGQSQWALAPSLRLDFRPTRSLYFEFEAGYERTQRDMPVQAMDLVGTYFRLGFRTMF
jgi:hypothetical protein